MTGLLRNFSLLKIKPISIQPIDKKKLYFFLGNAQKS